MRPAIGFPSVPLRNRGRTKFLSPLPPYVAAVIRSRLTVVTTQLRRATEALWTATEWSPCQLPAARLRPFLSAPAIVAELRCTLPCLVEPLP